MSASQIGHLCYAHNSQHLAHSQDGHLIFKKLDLLGWAKVTIEWSNNDRDLDILGFWDGDPSRKCGWNQGYSGPYHSGLYQSDWSGDDTSEAGTEIINLYMNPWAHSNRVYKIYFNFYGQGSSCNVYVEQNGKTLSRSQPCSSRSGKKAETTDPGCLIEFNEDGSLKRISGVN